MNQAPQTITNNDLAKFIDGLIAKGETDVALQKCLELSKSNPENYIIYYYLAKIFDIKNDAKNSLNCARHAYNKGINEILHLDYIGNIFCKYKQHAEARICFENILKILKQL